LSASPSPPPRLDERLRRLIRLRRALGLVREAAPGWAWASLALLVGQAAVPLLGLLLVKLLVDSITRALAAPAPLMALGEPLGYVLLIGLVALAASLLQALSSVVGEGLGQKLTDHVQGLIHARSVELDLAYFETPSYYDHLHRAQREGGHRPAQVVSGLAALLRGGLSLLGVAGLLLAFDPFIVLLLAAAAVPGLLVRLRHSRQLYGWRLFRTATERLLLLHDWMLTHQIFAKEVRLFGLGPHLQRRHRELRDTLRRERMSLARRRAAADVMAQSAGTVAVVLAMGFLVKRVVLGTITLGALVMYYQALQRGLGYLQQVLTALAGLYEDSLFLANLEQFLEQRPRVVDPPDPVPLDHPGPLGIRLERVTFRYPGRSEEAVRGVCLEIGAGEIAAVVGRNGSGKTTLVKLLCRLYDPDEGQVLLGGHDLRRYRVAELRRQFGVIFQDFAQFPVTVRENIGFGDTARAQDGEAVRAAAAWAGALPLIDGLPQGLDTLLGRWFSGGHELSHGEWQRVALARARFRDARVVVLDEPTSSLDALAEADLLGRLRQLLDGRTALFISHRFSSVRSADRIFVMDGGAVVETGRHEELMACGGLYARMFRAQAERYT
jgi:ATP-binding cassette subfamily B protein